MIVDYRLLMLTSLLVRNPYEKKFKAGSAYLEPRTSFKRWSETIAGRSKEWTEDQRKTLG
jgi:light-regulated signal transduction histidine kinase (bacteriophytochrome)